MNTDPSLEDLRTGLRQLGFRSALRTDVPDDVSADAFVDVSRPSGATRTYAVDVKRQVSPALATALHKHTTYPTLVVTRSIGERAAELLRARGINYLDEAGNAYLAWDDVLIDIRGRRKAGGQTNNPSSRGGKAFSRAGLQVGFVLLSWPHLSAEPLRQLASISGVSLGTAKMVIDELSRAGYLYDAAGERRLGRAGELLNRWSEAYSITLSPALFLGEFSVSDISWWRTTEHDFLSSGVQLGGEAGASIIDPHLVPSTLTLYADELPSALLGRHRIVGAAPGSGNIRVHRRFWNSPQRHPIVPATLIYADLIASGDPRQRQHADRIRLNDDSLAALDRR